MPAFNKFEIGLVHIGLDSNLAFQDLDNGFSWDAGQFFRTLDLVFLDLDLSGFSGFSNFKRLIPLT